MIEIALVRKSLKDEMPKLPNIMHMVSSSNRSGHCPFTAKTRSSNLPETTNNKLVEENITYCVLEARRIGICSKCGKGLCASLFVGFLNSGLAGKTLKSSHHERYLKPFLLLFYIITMFMFVFVC